MLGFPWILFRALLSFHTLLLCKLTHLQGFGDHLHVDDAKMHVSGESLSSEFQTHLYAQMAPGYPWPPILDVTVPRYGTSNCSLSLQ